MNLFDSYVDAGLTFVSKKCTQAILQVCIFFCSFFVVIFGACIF